MLLFAGGLHIYGAPWFLSLLMLIIGVLFAAAAAGWALRRERMASRVVELMREGRLPVGEGSAEV